MSIVVISAGIFEQTADSINQRSKVINKQPDDIANLNAEDLKRYQDELAEEGYRLLSANTGAFAVAAFPLASEVWPEWENESGDSVKEAVTR